MDNNRHPAFLPYLYLVIASGFGALALSTCQIVWGGVSYHWLYLAILTGFTSALAVKIPEVNFRISIEDIFVFTNLILFGPAAGTVTAAIQGLIGSMRSKSVSRRLEFTLFNMGSLGLSAFLSGQVFFRLLGRGPLYGHSALTLREILVPMSALVLIYHLYNSGSVAAIIALELRKSVFTVWWRNLRWTLVTYLTDASVAALIGINVTSFTPAVLAVSAPIILISYFTYKTYKDKVEGHIRELRELNNLYLRTVESLALAVDAKDQTTHGHVRRVCAYALGLARLRDVTDPTELLAIQTGALLHDIGKLAVDDYILNKPGGLSKQEFEKIKTHSAAGEEILQQVQFPFPVAQYVRAHHERWDGTGYPDGLKGEQIPLGARILAIADAFDCIRSPRPYKMSFGIKASIQLMRAEAGAAFDPKLVELFVKHVEQLEAAAVAAAREMPELSFRKSSAEIESAGVPAQTITLSPAIAGELASLCDFCSSVGRQLNLPDILVNLECRLKRLLPYTTCIIFLENGDNTLKAAHVGGKFAEELRSIRMEFGKGVSGWAAAYKLPVLNTAPALDFQCLQTSPANLKDGLIVPMVVGKSCLGTISLYAEVSGSYSQEHLGLLQIFADQAAPLIFEARCSADCSPAEDILDPVTGAHRVRYLASVATELITSPNRSTPQFSLIYLGLTNLMELVDVHGPQMRDQILRRVAEDLTADIRDVDVLARFGQDGFVALLPGLGRDRVSRRAQQIGQIVSSIEAGQVARIVCRTGTASYPEDGNNVFALLEAAQKSTIQPGAAAEEAGHNVVGFRSATK